MRHNTTRDVRRAEKALVKKRILARSKWDWLTQPTHGWYYVPEGGRKYAHRLWGWITYTDEQIREGMRDALRAEGKLRFRDYGCGKDCTYCNPSSHYGVPIPIHKIKLGMEYDLRDYWESEE